MSDLSDLDFFWEKNRADIDLLYNKSRLLYELNNLERMGYRVPDHQVNSDSSLAEIKYQYALVKAMVHEQQETKEFESFVASLTNPAVLNNILHYTMHIMTYIYSAPDQGILDSRIVRIRSDSRVHTLLNDLASCCEKILELSRLVNNQK